MSIWIRRLELMEIFYHIGTIRAVIDNNHFEFTIISGIK